LFSYFPIKSGLFFAAADSVLSAAFLIDGDDSISLRAEGVQAFVRPLFFMPGKER